MVEHGKYTGNERNKDMRRVMEREKVVETMDVSPSEVKQL